MSTKPYLLAIALFCVLCACVKSYASIPCSPERRVAVVIVMDNDDDMEVVKTIYTSLMTAEKVAKVLDVELIANDQVNDDVFVFALESEAQKDLTMKMFDEEGYEVTAHREFGVEQGKNYNALNVKTMDEGTYLFQLTDREGKEKSMRITIDRD